MTNPPPLDDETSWSWIGEVAHRANVYAMQGPLFTLDGEGKPVAWFMKRTNARRHLNVALVNHLLTIGRVYLMTWRGRNDPDRIIDMRTPNRSRPIGLKGLESLMRKNAQAKP